jgi:hypothetical protein
MSPPCRVLGYRGLCRMWHKHFFCGLKATRDIIIRKYFQQKMDKINI